jgi:hypothetical protein
MGTFGLAQDGGEKDSEETIEAERKEMMRKWGAEALPRPAAIAEKAKALFAKPLDKQGLDELSDIANEANTVANLIGFILEAYKDYRHDSYRYDFVLEKLNPFHDDYVRRTNEFKGYRNRAYFNLGLKHRDAGSPAMAFFYFRDAFRLSTFTESEGDHKGMRFQAEIEMKKILGIEDMGTFVHWE